MTTQMKTPAAKRRMRHPKIVISADELAHIEALADGAVQRNPALADRLLEDLGRARIVPAQKMPKTVIGINSTATYTDEGTGQQRRVTLVYPEKADIDQQRISLMTPIGVALLGLSEGASFYWDTRDNERRMLTVTRVEQPLADEAPGV